MDFNFSFAATANPDTLYDLIIIGGGPAGLAAGLYAARYKLKTLLIEKMIASGGQLTNTEWIENYPGFPQPVLGQKLARDMETQAKQFGLEVITEEVTSVDFSGKIKQVKTPYATWKAKTILVTTGSSPRKLNASGEAEFKGNGVSYCATCDGPFYPDKVIAAVGGGNTAFEEAQFLAKYASKLYLIHRSDKYRADEVLQERVKANPKIELLPFYTVEKIDFANPDGRRIILRQTQDGSDKVLAVDAVFVFVGNDPNTKVFAGQLELADGYIVTDREHHTSILGVWAAGDVQAQALRQVATAVGDGAFAAYQINKYLENWSE